MARLNLSPCSDDRATTDVTGSLSPEASSNVGDSAASPVELRDTSTDAPPPPTPTDGLCYHLQACLRESSWHLTPAQTAAAFGSTAAISRRFLLALREFAACKKPSLDFEEALGLIHIARDERRTQGGSRGVSRRAEFLVPDVKNALKGAKSGAIYVRMKGPQEPKGAKKGARGVNQGAASGKGVCSQKAYGVSATTLNGRQVKKTTVRLQRRINKEGENSHDDIENHDNEAEELDFESSMQSPKLVNRKSGRNKTSHLNGKKDTRISRENTASPSIDEEHSDDEARENRKVSEDNTNNDPASRGRRRKRRHCESSDNDTAKRRQREQVRSSHTRRHTISSSPSVERPRGTGQDLLDLNDGDFLERFDDNPLYVDDDEPLQDADEIDSPPSYDIRLTLPSSPSQSRHPLVAKGAAVSRYTQTSPTLFLARPKRVESHGPSGPSSAGRRAVSVDTSDLLGDRSHFSNPDKDRSSFAFQCFKSRLPETHASPPTSMLQTSGDPLTSMLHEMRLIYGRSQTSVDESIANKKAEAKSLHSAKARLSDDLKPIEQAYKTCLEKQQLILSTLEGWNDWERTGSANSKAGFVEEMNKLVKASLDDVENHRTTMAVIERNFTAVKNELRSISVGRDLCERWARAAGLIKDISANINDVVSQ